MTGDQQDIAGRLLALLPRWFGDNPPLLTRLLNGLANAHSFIYAMIADARNQTRIKTATGGWLDMIAADFFGRAVLRANGQSDASFLVAIQRNMFRERGTRNAITKALQDLTGSPPIILEPARPADTGAYGATETVSFVGTPQIYKTDWQGQQLQYATARTNYALNDVGAWGLSNASVTHAVQVAPDGSTDAFLIASGITGFSTVASSYQGPLDPNGSIIEHVWVMAGNVSAIDFGIWDSLGWGNTSTVTSARIVSGSGVISQNSAAFWHVSGLSATNWTLLELTRTGFGTSVPAFYFYPRQAGASQLGDNFYLFGLDAKPGLTYTSFIKTTTAPVTLTDYAMTPDGTVTFAGAPGANAVLSWTGTYASAMLGQNFSFSNATFGGGDGFTLSWKIARPYGYALGYDFAGGYGSLAMPMQAFVTAFKPKGNAIANLGGYGSSVFGYRQSASGAWADLGMMQQAISESDIYAAIEAVRPATSVLWTRIASNQSVTLDYTFVLDRNTLGGAQADTLDKSFVLDQSTLDAAPAAQLDQNFVLDTSQLS